MSQAAQAGIICFREHQMSSEKCLGLLSFYVTQSYVSLPEHWEVRLGWNWDRNLGVTGSVVSSDSPGEQNEGASRSGSPVGGAAMPSPCWVLTQA